MALAYQPPVSDENGPLAIRPSWTSLGRWELHVAPFFLLAMFLVLARFIGPRTTPKAYLVFLIIFGPIIAGYVLSISLYMLGTRIVVSNDAILITHWFVSTASVPTSEIARVIRVTLTISHDRNVPWGRPAVIALSSSGKCVLSLWTERWNSNDLDRIWRHLGIEAETWGGTRRMTDLRDQFPGAF